MFEEVADHVVHPPSRGEGTSGGSFGDGEVVGLQNELRSPQYRGQRIPQVVRQDSQVTVLKGERRVAGAQFLGDLPQRNESSDLAAENLGGDGLFDVVDGAERVSPLEHRSVWRHGGNEDDRRLWRVRRFAKTR